MFWIYTREKVVWGETEYVKVWKKNSRIFLWLLILLLFSVIAMGYGIALEQDTVK